MFFRRKSTVFLILLVLPFFSWGEDAFFLDTKEEDVAIGWLNKAQEKTGALAHREALSRIYQFTAFSALWTDYRAKEELETQLNVIFLSGFSEDFSWRVQKLKALRQNGDWHAYDVLATDSLLSLISYIGHVSEYGKNWFFGGEHTEVLPVPADFKLESLMTALQDKSLYEFVFHLRPKTPQYEKMRQAIVSFQDSKEKIQPRISMKKVIRRGDIIENRADFIALLNSHGLLNPLAMADLNREKEKTYNRVLENAVKAFQFKYGLNDDGVIGHKTMAWLNKSAKERIHILALNMERLRLWPTQRDHIILVNIPSYEMKMWQSSKLLLDSKVVVGHPSRRTPLIESKLDTVVINPKWNVPEKIMREDILPKVKKNPAYLQQNAYTVLDQWWSGEAISEDKIDWKNLNPSQFPYRLQQSPGNLNALGRYKFNTPNKSAIYLHDTPSQGLFQRQDRAFSSGCIRLSNAKIFAETLFSLSGLNLLEFNAYNQSFETKNVALTTLFDFFTIYQTAWVDSEGALHFRDDIYHYDLKIKNDISSLASKKKH